MYWIIWDLADAMKDIDIAPPIQSRMYQELSNGMSLLSAEISSEMQRQKKNRIMIRDPFSIAYVLVQVEVILH